MPHGWQKNASISWKMHEAFAGHEYLAALGGFLKVNGVETIQWLDCGAPNVADSEIIAYARENEFIVFTHDLDFSTLLAYSKDSKPSVIQLPTNDISPEAAGKAIVATLRQMSSELEAGALLTIDQKRSRIRLLPL